MTDGNHRQFVRMTRYERSKLVDQMDAAAREVERLPRGQRPYRRKSFRWEYRLEELAVTVEHPGGGLSRILVCSRNLNDDGISFIHGGYLYAGSQCRFRLPRFDGLSPMMTGSVIYCQYIDGNVHEVGVKFHEPIDPKLYLVSKPKASVDLVEACEPSELVGDLLAVNDCEPDRLLLAHRLRETKVELTAVPDGEAAIEKLGERSYDVIICDLVNGGECGLSLIEQMRKAHVDTSIILLTAETDPDRIDKAFAAGADHLLGKPYDPAELFALLFEIQHGTAGNAGKDRLFSSMQHDDGMLEIVSSFVEHTKGIAEALHQACMRGEPERARALCLNLKGSAAGVGFAVLSQAADEAIHALETGTSLDEAEPHLRRLRHLCERLGVQAA